MKSLRACALLSICGAAVLTPRRAESYPLVLEFCAGTGATRSEAVSLTVLFASKLFETKAYDEVRHSIKQDPSMDYLPCFSEECAAKAVKKGVLSQPEKIFIGRLSEPTQLECKIEIKRLDSAALIRESLERTVPRSGNECEEKAVEEAVKDMAFSLSGVPLEKPSDTGSRPDEPLAAPPAAVSATDRSTGAILVQRAMATDNSAESEKYLTLAIKAEPAYAEPRILRGILYSSTRRFKKALADLDAAILIDPHDARIYAEKGHVYLHLKNFARAEANLKTALQLDPELLSALMDLARVRWAGHKDAGGAVVYLRSAVSAGMDAAQVIAAAEDKADMLSGLAETPQFASVFAKK